MNIICLTILLLYLRSLKWCRECWACACKFSVQFKYLESILTCGSCFNQMGNLYKSCHCCKYLDSPHQRFQKSLRWVLRSKIVRRETSQSHSEMFGSCEVTHTFYKQVSAPSSQWSCLSCAHERGQPGWSPGWSSSSPCQEAWCTISAVAVSLVDWRARWNVSRTTVHREGQGLVIQVTCCTDKGVLGLGGTRNVYRAYLPTREWAHLLNYMPPPKSQRWNITNTPHTHKVEHHKHTLLLFRKNMLKGI